MGISGKNAGAAVKPVDICVPGDLFVNEDFHAIETVLTNLKSQYAAYCSRDIDDPRAHITERDIVAEIRHVLLGFCTAKGLHVHCEIRPASGQNMEPADMKRLSRIDVVVLRDRNRRSWLAAAKTLQGKYKKGSIEARFASVPVKFFHTAIEAKIQSDVRDAKKDIDTLARIQQRNRSCNCFFVLLNARGRPSNHDRIIEYGQKKKITVVEYTAQREA